MLTRTQPQGYQRGSLSIERRNRQTSVWVYRWREAGPGGTRVRRKHIVGTLDDLKTKAAAQRAVDGLRLEINVEAPVVASRSLSLSDVVSHYRDTELAQENTRKSPSTKLVYGQFLDSYILPHWGDRSLRDFRPVFVEKWLESLPYAPGTCAKIRNIIAAVFQHAIRHGWAENNPIHAVRVSAKRQTEPEILEPEEIQLLITELPEPVRTMALMAAVTGLRVSEILGLKWQDVDLVSAVIHLRRGVVNQEVSNLKTIGSRRSLPIPSALVAALGEWQKQTGFAKPSDWVYASPHVGGEQPYWPGTLLTRHVQPAAKRVGIVKQVGWHSFRRSFASLLYASEQDAKVTQELMRHSTPNITLGIYAQAVTGPKRLAQERLATAILRSGEREPMPA